MINENKLEDQITAFLERIYRIKQLIVVHTVIAKNSNNIKYQSFFGMLQSTILNRAVLIELFSILDQKGNRTTLTKLIDQLIDNNRKTEIKKQLDLILGNWNKVSGPLKTVRDKDTAHFDDFDIYTQQDIHPEYKIDYSRIFPLVNETEKLLISISNEKRPNIQSLQVLEEYDQSIRELREIIQVCSTLIYEETSS